MFFQVDIFYIIVVELQLWRDFVICDKLGCLIKFNGESDYFDELII